MKEYKKAQIIAKNLPTGSYAAGCPTKSTTCGSRVSALCKKCEIAS